MAKFGFTTLKITIATYPSYCHLVIACMLQLHKSRKRYTLVLTEAHTRFSSEWIFAAFRIVLIMAVDFRAIDFRVMDVRLVVTNPRLHPRRNHHLQHVVGGQKLLLGPAMLGILLEYIAIWGQMCLQYVARPPSMLSPYCKVLIAACLCSFSLSWLLVKGGLKSLLACQFQFAGKAYVLVWLW